MTRGSIVTTGAAAHTQALTGCRGLAQGCGLAQRVNSGLTKVIDRVVVNCLLPVDRSGQRLDSISQVAHFVLQVQHDKGQDTSQHLQAARLVRPLGGRPGMIQRDSTMSVAEAEGQHASLYLHVGETQSSEVLECRLLEVGLSNLPWLQDKRHV